MFDSNGLIVTADYPEIVPIINRLTDLFFRKKSGLEKLLPEKAGNYPNCPLLQIYAAYMYVGGLSAKATKAHFPTYLSRIDAMIEKGVVLNEREKLHFSALKLLFDLDLSGALDIYIQLSTQFPKDLMSITMIEICGFYGGRIDSLLPIYNYLLDHHDGDPDFMAMYGFLLCHLDRQLEARNYVEHALAKEPHNAWVQHVYAHTLNESDVSEVNLGIQFLEENISDWPKQNRFFEGHNWMHLIGLYYLRGNLKFESILGYIENHVWGEAKAYNYEQNNVFWILWQADLNGYASQIPTWLKKDLAEHARPFMTDYVTPYLTICAILSVAQYSLAKAQVGIEAFKIYASSRGGRWETVGLPILLGCVEYLKGDYQSAHSLLSAVASDIKTTRPLCHSDEQRIIFPATLERIKQLLTANK